eukprot:NODE_136_length_16465_cov_1.184957.p3 type:complete len:842 gc:universal NODE_136_length_16465_cov_1.184957:3926-6451(+)
MSMVDEETIQVLVRIRPTKKDSVVIADPLTGRQLQIPCNASALAPTKTFLFDKVLGTLVDNKTVFQQVQPLIDQVLQGFNATILAYGQTSTGKTHTILGNTSLQDGRLGRDAGIIPRAINYIFDQLDKKKGDILDYSIRISYLELYNEDLRDLLVENTESLKIFEENKKILVQGMEEMLVRNLHHCLEMVQIASEKRQTATTLCNEKSSRSHTIFVMQVLQREVVNGKEILRLGKLNLVDLAGSESIGKSGVEKKGQREAGLINQSLLTLGRVINALVDKNSHIPYRESKLTRLLKDSLGGHTKTTLIATISGEKSSLEETLSTLDYSHRAKNIKVRPQINQRITKQELMKGYMGEIETLRKELIATRSKNGVYFPVEQYEELMNEHHVIKQKNGILNQQVESLEGAVTSLMSENQQYSDRISELEDTLKNQSQKYFQLSDKFIQEKALNNQQTIKDHHLMRYASQLEENFNNNTIYTKKVEAELNQYYTFLEYFSNLNRQNIDAHIIHAGNQLSNLKSAASSLNLATELNDCFNLIFSKQSQVLDNILGCDLDSYIAKIIENINRGLSTHNLEVDLNMGNSVIFNNLKAIIEQLFQNVTHNLKILRDKTSSICVDFIANYKNRNENLISIIENHRGYLEDFSKYCDESLSNIIVISNTNLKKFSNACIYELKYLEKLYNNEREKVMDLQVKHKKSMYDFIDNFASALKNKIETNVADSVSVAEASKATILESSAKSESSIEIGSSVYSAGLKESFDKFGNYKSDTFQSVGLNLDNLRDVVNSDFEKHTNGSLGQYNSVIDSFSSELVEESGKLDIEFKSFSYLFRFQKQFRKTKCIQNHS